MPTFRRSPAFVSHSGSSAASVLILACAVACSSSPQEVDSKYVQTWPQSYGDTDCREWLEEMTPEQQFTMAGDMLLTAWKGDGETALPTDTDIEEFAQGIGTACVIPTSAVPEIAALLYVTAEGAYSP